MKRNDVFTHKIKITIVKTFIAETSLIKSIFIHSTAVKTNSLFTIQFLYKIQPIKRIITKKDNTCDIIIS